MKTLLGEYNFRITHVNHVQEDALILFNVPLHTLRQLGRDIK